ncbi:MAG: fluoride efflux transporter CrcB [Chloroflexi bacterium]|nr:fluoride efflux transporter CrcB [Chloroflexota bacterium]
MDSGFLAISAGAVLGANLRFALTLALERLFPAFPLGTLAVNVVGSLIAGIAIGWIEAGAAPAGAIRLFLVVGFCGAFTTFSAFSLETFSLARAGLVTAATGYVVASIALCLAATGLGFLLGGAARP